MIFYRLQLIIPLILVLATSTYVNSVTNNVTDQQALLQVKASIKTDPSNVLSSWNNSVHFCQWEGVTCSRRRQRVTTLRLSSLDLAGTLSSHIGNLSFLRVISLRGNNFYGSIPNEIGRLRRLHYLHLGANSFQGGFPANLSHCVDITNISMHGNDLQGKLPTQFASWSKLYVLSLGDNHFVGPIPPSIGNISSLRILALSGNNLSGTIPMEVAYHAKLEHLSLSLNNLWGKVALQLYNSSFLSILGIDNNAFVGTLPTDLGFTLSKLQEFTAGWNRFSGPLPPSIANASNLVKFDLPYNNITGLVPTVFENLSNLRVLNLGANQLGFNHPSDMNFFNSLVNCTQLRVLRFYENGLKGELPVSIVNLSTTVEILDVFGNHIYGSIPREIGKLVNLLVLSLYRNYLI